MSLARFSLPLFKMTFRCFSKGKLEHAFNIFLKVFFSTCCHARCSAVQGLGKILQFFQTSQFAIFRKKRVSKIFLLLFQVQVVSNRQLGKTLFCFRENERNISFPPFEAMRKSCKRPFFFLSRLGKKKKNCLRTTVGFPDPWRKSRIRTR